MTVRLRPHHLLCLLTYVGKGYSPAFTAGFDAVARRIAGGEPVLIVAGPDDVCAPLAHQPDAHCRRDGVTERDRLAARDVGGLLGRPIETGSRLAFDPALVARMREAFAADLVREACRECPWSGLCTDIADGGYVGTIVPHRVEPRGVVRTGRGTRP